MISTYSINHGAHGTGIFEWNALGRGAMGRGSIGHGTGGHGAMGRKVTGYGTGGHRAMGRKVTGYGTGVARINLPGACIICTDGGGIKDHGTVCFAARGRGMEGSQADGKATIDRSAANAPLKRNSTIGQCIVGATARRNGTIRDCIIGRGTCIISTVGTAATMGHSVSDPETFGTAIIARMAGANAMD